MPLSTGIKLLLGGAAAAAVVGIAALASASKPAAAPPGPTPPAGPSPPPGTLKAGERYLVTQTAAVAVPVTVLQAQGLFDAIAPGAIRVVRINQVSPTIVTMTIDAVKNLPIVLPPTMTLQDLGPSPPGGAPPLVSPPPPSASPPPPPAGGLTLTPGQTYTITGPVDPNLPGPAFAASVQAGLTMAGAQAGPQWQNVSVSVSGPTFTATGTYAGPVQQLSPTTLPPGWSVTPGGAPATAPASTSATWAPNGASDLPGRARVRATVPLAAYVGLDPNAQPSLSGLRDRFAAFIARPNTLFAAIGAPFVWSPGDALPADWPLSDANAAPSASFTTTGFHFEFVNPFDTPISLADLRASIWSGASGPAPDVWIAEGSGQAPAVRVSPLSWPPAQSISPGDHVRANLLPSDLMTLVGALSAGAANALPYHDNSCATLLGVVEQTAFHAIVGPGGVLAWCGIDLLPPDWPSGGAVDPGAAYHVEFRFTGASPISVGALPIPITAYVASGLGA
jgi:hypothetical protein